MTPVTNLIRRPRVRAVTRTVYVIDWEYYGVRYFTDHETGHSDVDQVRCSYSKTMLTKHSAYRRAAWAYVVNRRAANECTRDGCQFGKYEFVGDGSPTGIERDTRCQYCNPEKSRRIVERLARWLKWRDQRLAQIESEDAASNAAWAARQYQESQVTP